MILTYHNIGEGKDKTWLTLEIFKKQIQEIKENNLEVVTFEQYDKFNSKHIIITFDDGRKNILEALEILKENGFPFYVFVVGENIGKSEEFFSEEDFNQIKEYGGHIGWHTWTHPDLTKLSTKKIKKELKNPYGFDILAYPYWKNNRKIWDIAKEFGYKYCRSGNGYANIDAGDYSLDSAFVQDYTNIKFVNDKIVRYMEMENKIKKFIDTYIPVTSCNFRCHYCYITQQHLWKNKSVEFKYPIESIKQALSINRLDGICMFNLCGGGETLIPHETVDITKILLEEGHYVSIITNGTITKHIEEILKFPDYLLERLFFKFSFQFLELKRTNQMENFFANIKQVKNSKCSFSLEITPNEELIPYIDEIKEITMKNVGALPHITVGRDYTKNGLPILTNLPRDEYKKLWSQFDSGMFNYKISVFGKKIKDFCYAGAWSYVLNLGSGELSQCYSGKVLQNIFENVDKPIKTCAIGKCCSEPHCFNAHAWLTWGDVPNHKAPTYLVMRDRIDQNGEHWIKEPMRSFMSSKLNELNKEYTIFQKNKNALQNLFSIKNEYKNNKKHKVITIMGLKVKLKTAETHVAVRESNPAKPQN